MDIRKVQLVDDHVLLRIGLRRIIDQETDLHVVAEADDGETAIQLAREHEPDFVVMEIFLPWWTQQVTAARCLYPVSLVPNRYRWDIGTRERFIQL